MKSKAEIIHENLPNKIVLDIGGVGYCETNAYERELSDAWKKCKRRITVDTNTNADIVANLNNFPLPEWTGENIDIATAFDVLEHLERPVDVLRWIPATELIVTLPNAISFINRRMEQVNNSQHLYSFTAYTASIMLKQAGWKVKRIEYQFGKWSLVSRLINLIGSLAPKHIATGIILHCEK